MFRKRNKPLDTSSSHSCAREPSAHGGACPRRARGLWRDRSATMRNTVAFSADRNRAARANRMSCAPSARTACTVQLLLPSPSSSSPGVVHTVHPQTEITVPPPISSGPKWDGSPGFPGRATAKTGTGTSRAKRRRACTRFRKALAFLLPPRSSEGGLFLFVTLHIANAVPRANCSCGQTRPPFEAPPVEVVTHAARSRNGGPWPRAGPPHVAKIRRSAARSRPQSP